MALAGCAITPASLRFLLPGLRPVSQAVSLRRWAPAVTMTIPRSLLMIRVPHRSLPLAGAALLTLLTAAPIATLDAQSKSAGAAAAKAQKIDEAYTAKIKEYTTDPRVITELV